MNPTALIAGLARRGLSFKQIQTFLSKAPDLFSKAKLAIPKNAAKGAKTQVDDLLTKAGIKSNNSGVTRLTADQIKKLQAHKALNQQAPRTDVRSTRTSSRPTKKTNMNQWLDGLRWGQAEDAAVRATVQALEENGVDPDSPKGTAFQIAATAASAGLGVVQAARGRGSTGLGNNSGLSPAQAARRAARGETQSARGGQIPNPRKNNPERVARQSQRRAERKGIKRDFQGNPIGDPTNSSTAAGVKAGYVAGQRAVKGAQADIAERLTSDQVRPFVEQEIPKQTIDDKVQNALAIQPGDNFLTQTGKRVGQGLVIMGEATGIPGPIRSIQDSFDNFDRTEDIVNQRRSDMERKFGVEGKVQGGDAKVIWAGPEWGWLEPKDFQLVDDARRRTGKMPQGGDYKKTALHWQPIGFEGAGQAVQQIGQALQPSQIRGRSGAMRDGSQRGMGI